MSNVPPRREEKTKQESATRRGTILCFVHGALLQVSLRYYYSTSCAGRGDFRLAARFAIPTFPDTSASLIFADAPTAAADDESTARYTLLSPTLPLTDAACPPAADAATPAAAAAAPAGGMDGG